MEIEASWNGEEVRARGNPQVDTGRGKDRMVRKWLRVGWMVIWIFWLQERTGWPEAFEAPGLGARAFAMGGAFIGLADDWTAIYWNPAGLARLPGLHAGFNLFSPRFNDYDGDSVHNFDPENFRLQQGDVFPRLHRSEPSRFNEKWSHNFAMNPSFAVILGSGPDPESVEGWTLATGVYFPIGNLLAWDDRVRDPATRAWITADWQGTDWSPMRAKLHFEKPGRRGLLPLRGDPHWKRSSRLRFGTEYGLSPRWRLRAGYFYNSPSLPDEASSLTTIVDVPLHTFSLGGSREWGNWTWDFALAYRFGGRDVGGVKHHFDALFTMLSFGWHF